MDLLLMSPDELREIASDSGWELEKTIDGEEGNYAAILRKQAEAKVK